MSNGWAPGQYLDLEPRLFLYLTHQRLLGILIKLDVTADRQPFAVSFVIDQQNLVLVNDEYGDDKIKFLVDMRQGSPVLSRAGKQEGRGE